MAPTSCCAARIRGGWPRRVAARRGFGAPGSCGLLRGEGWGRSGTAGLLRGEGWGRSGTAGLLRGEGWGRSGTAGLLRGEGWGRSGTAGLLRGEGWGRSGTAGLLRGADSGRPRAALAARPGLKCCVECFVWVIRVEPRPCGCYVVQTDRGAGTKILGGAGGRRSRGEATARRTSRRGHGAEVGPRGTPAGLSAATRPWERYRLGPAVSCRARTRAPPHVYARSRAHGEAPVHQ